MFEITLSGPGKNALNTGMMTFIQEKLREAAGHPVLLTGSGDAFCAGLDLKQLGGLDAPGMEAFLQQLEDMVADLYTYPGPTVALVNGHAVAGGCVLAQCCDVRVAASDPRIRIGLNEVAIGLRFPPRTFAVVRRRIPVAFREQVILGAELFSPSGALRVGLVDDVADDAATVARERLAVLSKHPAGAYAAVKADLRGPLGPTPGDDRFLHEEVLGVWTSDAIRARIQAVLKR